MLKLILILLVSGAGFARSVAQPAQLPKLCSIGLVQGLLELNQGFSTLANLDKRPSGASVVISQARADGQGPTGQMVIAGIMTAAPFAKIEEVTVLIVPAQGGGFDVNAAWVRRGPARRGEAIWVQIQLFASGFACQ